MNSLWLVVYLAALGIISWLGNFDGGLRVIPEGIDSLAIVLASLAVFWMAIRFRLPESVVRRRIAETDARLEPS